MKMKVAYVLSGTALAGGSKVVFEHVRLLNRTGFFDACVVSPEPYPKWIHFKVPFIMTDLKKLNLNLFDLVVTTFYDQGFLYRNSHVCFLHFCQGYEGDYTADLGLSHLDEEIERFYSFSCPKMVVSRFLMEKLRLLTDAPILFVGQILDREIFKPVVSNCRKYILVVGQSEYPFKGVKRSLSVAMRLKEIFPDLKVMRVSPTDTRKDEAMKFFIDEFWIRVPPVFMSKIYSKAILSIYMPYKDGFGLPVLESIASGVPVIASDIPPFREICGSDYPLCRTVDDAVDLGVKMLTNTDFYRTLSTKGVQRSYRFNTSGLLLRLIRAFLVGIMWGKL